MAGKTVHKLKMPDQFRLMELVRDEYASSGKNDEEFAAYATEKLDVLVNPNNVLGAREAFGIKTQVAIARSMSNAALERRVADLELAVKTLMLAAKHNKS